MIPVNEPLLDGNEKKYLAECIDSGWISSEGPFVSKFEDEFAKRCGRKYGVAVSNGTAAIDIAIEALGLGSGDEVILPTFTIISCISQIIRSGATPILVDSDIETFNMDVAQVEKKITSRTRAIMVVHIYGLPVDMNPILNLVNKYNLKLIEDAAEVIGQDYYGKSCGSFGDISTFSFYPNKHITTGEGGMILTDSYDLAQSCRELRNLCFRASDRFVHERLGWNYRMTNLQAAVGVAQLERLDEFIVRKKRMGAIYSELLEGIPGIRIPIKSTAYADNIYWVYGLVLDSSKGSAREVMKKLEMVGIGTRPFFYPMHLQPVFQNLGIFKRQKYLASENLYHQGFYIPSGLGLSLNQIEEVADKVKKVLK